MSLFPKKVEYHFNIYVETVIHFVQDILMNRKFKKTAFIWKKNVL